MLALNEGNGSSKLAQKKAMPSSSTPPKKSLKQSKIPYYKKKPAKKQRPKKKQKAAWLRKQEKKEREEKKRIENGAEAWRIRLELLGRDTDEINLEAYYLQNGSPGPCNEDSADEEERNLINGQHDFGNDSL